MKSVGQVVDEMVRQHDAAMAEAERLERDGKALLCGERHRDGVLKLYEAATIYDSLSKFSKRNELRSIAEGAELSRSRGTRA